MDLLIRYTYQVFFLPLQDPPAPVSDFHYNHFAYPPWIFPRCSGSRSRCYFPKNNPLITWFFILSSYFFDSSFRHSFASFQKCGTAHLTYIHSFRKVFIKAHHKAFRHFICAVHNTSVFCRKIKKFLCVGRNRGVLYIEDPYEILSID